MFFSQYMHYVKYSKPSLKILSSVEQQQQNNSQSNKFVTQACELHWEVPGKTAESAPVKC